MLLIRLAVALSQLLPIAAAAAPAVDASTVDKVAGHAEGWPMTIGFFLMLGAIGYLIRWLITSFWPEWQTAQTRRSEVAVSEAEKTRAHMTQMMRDRDEAAGKREKEIIEGLGAKVEVVVATTRELSGRIRDVSERVSGMHDVIRIVAGKVGVGGLVMAVSLGLLGAAMMRRAVVRTAAASVAEDGRKPDCSEIGGCAAPSWCCKTNVCCRRTSGAVESAEAVAASGPQSADWTAVDYGTAPFAAADARRFQM